MVVWAQAHKLDEVPSESPFCLSFGHRISLYSLMSNDLPLLKVELI